VGADGLRSITARRHRPVVSAHGGHYSVGAHFEGVETATPRGDLHLGPGWYAGAAHYGGGVGNIVAAVPRDAFRRAHGDVEAVFARALRGLPSLEAAMRTARRRTPFVIVGPLAYARRRAVEDGLVLVGDAAAAINPMTGEGLAMALRGAELASDAVERALRHGGTGKGNLASYERARAAAFGDTWRASRLLQWIVRRPRLARALFRRVAGDPGLAALLLAVVSGQQPASVLTGLPFLARLATARGARW
jgi:flavin-dependent dehydrogenase